MQVMHVADPHAHKWLFESRRCVAEPGWRNGASSRPGGTGCGSASASRRPRSPWPGSWRSSSTACGVMKPTSSGQARRRQLRKTISRNSARAETMSLSGRRRRRDRLRLCDASNEASASSTLIHQRPPTPSCRGLSPYCGENSEPDRYSMESLTFNPELENSLG